MTDQKRDERLSELSDWFEPSSAPSTPAARPPVADLSLERIKRRQGLCGLINEYERAA